MLKVLYLPLNDADSVQQGMYDGWNNVGVNLQIFDFYRQWLNTKNKSKIQTDFINKVKEFQPHLIHMQLQFTGLISAATLIEARKACPGVVITNWSGDIRKEAISDFTTLAHALDFALISSTGQLEMYRKAGCKNVRYWQIGYDPKLSFPMHKTEFKYDAAFLGNNYGNSFPDGQLRASAATKLKSSLGYRFGLFGGGYPNCHACSYRDANKIYSETICPVSISNFNSVSHYFSDRLLACVATGRPTISWHFPGIESYFVEGSEIFIVKSAQEIIDIVKWCKENPEPANKIGLNGYHRVLKEHTFTSKIVELLHMTNLSHLL